MMCYAIAFNTVAGCQVYCMMCYSAVYAVTGWQAYMCYIALYSNVAGWQVYDVLCSLYSSRLADLICYSAYYTVAG